MRKEQIFNRKTTFEDYNWENNIKIVLAPTGL
jgi:hypothetical protein